ncbi:MAG: bifunctional hydroxymethylpyrimidine kinase/phosphomethylpyrimidine kinase [Tidjanibacter sp.]|nr:bifunctional hydroxymethylpyrimidine kinase/phosphomethylpyrimidine kinase [Tidjanibacter sp.]
MEYKKVLTIAGSDSGGGAGIQADIKAISACGCYAASAITAITVQNTVGVKAIHTVPIPIIEGQIAAVLDDIGADAIKIGMLSSSEVMTAVAGMLDRFGAKNVVLDPVMVATSGDRLMEEQAVETLKNTLLPRARVITPNLPEAEILLGRKILHQSELPTAAKELSRGGTLSVLLKAGHLTDSELCDILYDAEQNRTVELRSRRVDTPNTHGTGCTLSSALAAFLAQGYQLEEAARQAKNYISEAILSGSRFTIGHGHGPVDHFYKSRREQ